jgi:hypothetical protein
METSMSTRRRGSSYDSFGTLTRPVSCVSRIKTHWRCALVLVALVTVGIAMLSAKFNTNSQDAAALIQPDLPLNSTSEHSRNLLSVDDNLTLIPFVTDLVSGHKYIAASSDGSFLTVESAGFECNQSKSLFESVENCTLKVTRAVQFKDNCLLVAEGTFSSSCSYKLLTAGEFMGKHWKVMAELFKFLQN